MVASQLFTARARRRLRTHIEAQHLATPYDFVYQFSTFESVGVPRLADLPVFIHPSVHAAGEARWIRAESTSGLSSRPWWPTLLVYLWMSARSLRQASDANRATGILALSSAMAMHIASDYGVAARRIRVVPNCLDPQLFERPMLLPQDCVTVVGRLVVRKGLDDMVRTVRDWPRDKPVSFEFIGAESLWSDYRRAIDELHDDRVTRVGHLSRADTIDHIARARVLVQASRYEPFGLTVAEALAVGVPVVVTKEVGAAEGVDHRVYRSIEIPAGNPRSVRTWTGSATLAITELWDMPDELRQVARDEARRLFHPRVVVSQLEDALRELLHLEG
jgi:glycosyltransferase involved in cell wall biosynthesis